MEKRNSLKENATKAVAIHLSATAAGKRSTQDSDANSPAKAKALAKVSFMNTKAFSVAANASGKRAVAVTDAQATDAFAEEALDATEGAFPTVADAIEVGLDSVTPSGFDSFVSTANSTGSKPGFQTASKAPLSMHIRPRYNQALYCDSKWD